MPSLNSALNRASGILFRGPCYRLLIREELVFDYISIFKSAFLHLAYVLHRLPS